MEPVVHSQLSPDHAYMLAVYINLTRDGRQMVQQTSVAPALVGTVCINPLTLEQIYN